MAAQPLAAPEAMQNEAAPTEVQRAGNFVRNLEAPKFGVERYIEEKLNNAGGRQLKGKGNKGFVYMDGHFKGMTEGQAREAARKAYAGMSPEARAPFEKGAQGRDVMSAGEVARENQFYNARGVAAGGGGTPVPGVTPRQIGTPPVTPSVAQPSQAGKPPVMATPPPSAADRAGAGTMIGNADGSNQPRPSNLGTINGTPVEQIRAESASRNPLSVPAKGNSVKPAQPSPPSYVPIAGPPRGLRKGGVWDASRAPLFEPLPIITWPDFASRPSTEGIGEESLRNPARPARPLPDGPK
jgi:hypothetical protein